MAATEIVYVRVHPDIKAQLDALVENGRHAWPRITMQGLVGGFIAAGLDRLKEEREAERKATTSRVVKGPQLPLKRLKVRGADVKRASKAARSRGLASKAVRK